MADNKSLDEMKADALRRQDNLASDINELLDRVNPRNAFERFKNEAADRTQSFFVADNGQPKPAPIAGVAGAAVGVITLAIGAAVLVSRIGNRKKRPINRAFQ